MKSKMFRIPSTNRAASRKHRSSCWRHSPGLPFVLGILACFAPVRADDGFRHFGDFLIHSRLKVTGDRVTRVAIKPLRLSVSTDGVTVRVSTEGEDTGWSSYTIYRSDGVGRQSSPGGPLEVVPGIQATNDSGGAHRHLRLTRDSLTLTVFPGVSDQTIITHATAAPTEPTGGSSTAPPEP